MTAGISYRKYVLLSILIILVTLVGFVLKPFIRAMLSSLVLAYVFFPLHRWLRIKVKKEWISAILISLLVVVIVTVPALFIANSVSNEVRVNYVTIKKVLATGELLNQQCVDSSIGCSFVEWFEGVLSEPRVKFYLTDVTSRVTDFLLTKVSAFIFGIPAFLLNFFITLFMLFYLLKEGDVIAHRVKNILPLKLQHREGMLKRFNDVTFAVIYGQLLVSAIQATLGGLFLWMFGVSSPLLWTVIMFFAALIPFLGTPVVWVPAMIVKFAQGQSGNGLGLLISGIFISVVDNFIRPRIVSSRASIHPILVLLGVLGGISVFGFIGIILGPVVLSIFMAFVEIYEEERDSESQDY